MEKKYIDPIFECVELNCVKKLFHDLWIPAENYERELFTKFFEFNEKFYQQWGCSIKGAIEFYSQDLEPSTGKIFSREIVGSFVMPENHKQTRVWLYFTNICNTQYVIMVDGRGIMIQFMYDDRYFEIYLNYRKNSKL